LAQGRRLKKEALDKEKMQVERQRKQLEEYRDTGEAIKEKIWELEAILKEDRKPAHLLKAARGQLPVLRAELQKIEMGLPKREEVFERFEGEYMVSWR